MRLSTVISIIAMLLIAFIASRCKTPGVTDTPVGVSTPSPELEWEQGHPERKSWSEYLRQQVEERFTALNAAEDLKDFCPNYVLLTHEQKVEALATLIVAVSLEESSFDPRETYSEPGMGTDPVTGKHVLSEGLLQLSYQDKLSYPKLALLMDYAKKNLQDPYVNLHDGLAILSDQAVRKHAISIKAGAYWSTLEPGTWELGKIKATVRGYCVQH